MGFGYIVSDGGNVVIEKWAGRISHAEFIDHEKEQLQDQSIAEGARVVVDARQAVFPEATPEGAHEFARIFSEPKSMAKFSRFALLVVGENWEKAKVLERELGKFGKRLITFNDLSTACTWLGVDTKSVLENLERIGI